MNLSTLLGDAYARNILIATGVCALFAISLIPAYFFSMRPARGTTEWMSRIDKPDFEPLSSEMLRWGDLPFALLSGVCAAILRMASFLCIYLHKGVTVEMHEVLPTLSGTYLLPCAILGIATYLLLRTMFDSTLPAASVAILSGLVQVGNAWQAAFVMLTFLFLWLWASLDADSGLIVRAVLLSISLMCYGLLLLRYWPFIWLAPVFIAAYVYAQVYRWRKTTRTDRRARLAMSLLFLFFAAVAAYAAAWAYFCVVRLGDASYMVNFGASFTVVSDALCARLNLTIMPFDPGATFLARDMILVLFGALSLIPIVHGIVRWHDAQCVAILALIPSFIALWLLGGLYLLVPMLSIFFGWVLSVIAKREYWWLVVGYCIVPTAIFLFEHFI